MYIRPYRDLPGMYAPDVGEVIMARRTPLYRWTRAIVLGVHRTREARLRVRLQWMEDDPNTGMVYQGRKTRPVVAGAIESFVTDPDDSLLISRIDRA